MLSPNDTLARAIITSVKAAGKPMPIITGQDSEVESVKSIMAGEQYSTINKDTRALVEHAIAMVKDIQAGKKPEINDDKSYNNRVKIVPAYLLDAGHRDQGQRQDGLRQRSGPRPADQVAP